MEQCDAGFCDMVVGAANKKAVEAAMLVAAGSMSHIMNPFFVMGEGGSGKTKLLNAIAENVKARNDGRKVLVLSYFDVVDLHIKALENSKVDVFRDMFKEADFLIIDDFEELHNSSAIQAELLRAIDGFMKADKQVVIATEELRYVLDHSSLNKKLSNRLCSGLWVKLSISDFDMRRAIVKHVATSYGVTFSESEVMQIASEGKKNLWHLSGAINKALFEHRKR